MRIFAAQGQGQPKDTSGKFTAGVLPPASTTPVANLPLISTTTLVLVAKFATGVIVTGGAP
jgi:hypothetical protein